MNDSPEMAQITTFSRVLLQLGREARSIAVAEFLRQAVGHLRKCIPIHSGWWGLAIDNGDDRPPLIQPAELLDLPDDFAGQWRSIARLDRFAGRLRQMPDTVHRFSGAAIFNPEQDPLVTEFERRYNLVHGMAIVLAEPFTGSNFFIVLYRGHDAEAFSNEEAELFHQLVLHIVQLWRHRLQDELASHNDMRHAAVVRRRDGRVICAGEQFCELLYREWPQWDGIRLPDDMVARFGELPVSVRIGSTKVDLSLRAGQVWLAIAGSGEGSPLSPREWRVAQLFAAGHSHKDIARRLELTPATVRTYLRNAYARLGVSNKIELGDALVAGLRRRAADEEQQA